jgi:hypothetical protein
MEKYINRYELAVILKSIEGEDYSKLADIVREIQEKHGNIKELEGYGWWPLQDEEEVYIDEDGIREVNVDLAFDHYNELPTRVAVKIISLYYHANKFFYDFGDNKEALEILEDLRKRHGKKYRWRTIGKEVAKKKAILHRVGEF